MSSTSPNPTFSAPSRTSTGSTTSSNFSGPASPGSLTSDPRSRDSYFVRRATDNSDTSQPASPSAADTFFGSIAQKVRGRSRSRNPPQSRAKSRSPLPPTNISTPAGSMPSSPTSPQAPTSRPQGARHYSSASQSSTSSKSSTTHKRQSGSSTDFAYYGRHTNQWLFGGFSVRETAKNVWEHRRDS
jgi:hypothetical protein